MNTQITVNITLGWCCRYCPGWERSKTSNLDQWVSPFLGFLILSVVFCLAIPRRRKLHIPEELFDVRLNEITSNIFRTPFIALVAAVLVTFDTIIWLMTVFTLSGPILLFSASFEERSITDVYPSHSEPCFSIQFSLEISICLQCRIRKRWITTPGIICKIFSEHTKTSTKTSRRIRRLAFVQCLQHNILSE